MCAINVGLVRHALHASFKYDWQGSHMRQGKLTMVAAYAVRSHRGVVHRAYCVAGKRKRAIVARAHVVRDKVILLCTEHRLTGNDVRIGAAFTGRLACAVQVQQHVVFRCNLHQVFNLQDRILGLGIKEVRLDALEAHLRPFGDALFLLFRGIQVCAVRPDNQADTLLIGIIDQLLRPIVIALVDRIIIRVSVLSLPAFVQQLVFPTHLCREVDIFLINVQRIVFEVHVRVGMAEIAVQPRPVHGARLDPTGVFQLAVLAQGFCHGVFCDGLRRADDGKAPRGGKRCSRNNVFRLLRREFYIQHTGAVAHKLCAAVGRIQVCFGKQRPNAVRGLIEERHAVAAAQSVCFLFLRNRLICIFIFHRLCDRAAGKLEARIFLRNGELLAVLGLDCIAERHAVVINAHNDAVRGAVLCEVQRHLVGGCVHMVHFRADQVIGIRDLFVFTAYKGEAVAEITGVGHQARRGAGNNRLAAVRGKEADGALRVHKEQGRDILVGRRDRPSCAFFAFANNNLTGSRAADARIHRIHHRAGDCCNAIRYAGDDTCIRIDRCNLRIAARIRALFRGESNALLAVRIRGDHQIGAIPHSNGRLLRLHRQRLQAVHHSAVADNLRIRPNRIGTAGVFHRQDGRAFRNFYIHRRNASAAGQTLGKELLAIRFQRKARSTPPVIRLNGNLRLEAQRTIARQIIDNGRVATGSESLLERDLLSVFIC